jgi:putative endonuclease
MPGLFYMFYVYIIKSTQDGTYYKGFSENPPERLRQHNEGLSRYTSQKKPWCLVFIQAFPTKKEALIREKKLKKFNHKSIDVLIHSALNQLQQLFPEYC